MLITMPAALATSHNEPASRFRDCPPVDFDPTACPILSRHWFGVEPSCPIGAVAAAELADLRFRRQVEHLHRLGPRAVGELLCEVAKGEDLDRALEPYQRLTPDLLKALGGDRFPPAPIYVVQR